MIYTHRLIKSNPAEWAYCNGHSVVCTPPPSPICLLDFLETKELQPLSWLRFINDIFFIWTHGKEELKKYMEKFNNFTPNLSFTY